MARSAHIASLVANGSDRQALLRDTLIIYLFLFGRDVKMFGSDAEVRPPDAPHGTAGRLTGVGMAVKLVQLGLARYKSGSLWKQ